MKPHSKVINVARCLVSLLATSWTTAAGTQPDASNPLAGLDELKEFQARRASSSDPDWKNGNADARPLEPGASLTLAELKGPGRIVHFWCTMAHSDPFGSRLMTLRIYWDGEADPSVESPLGDFVCVGNGVNKPVNSIPVRVSSEGAARNCYWPMPFRKSARITVSNDSRQRCENFYYYVDWQRLPSLSRKTAYFHARYRQEYPCVMGRNYLVAAIQGRGHYVGTVQSVVAMSDGWYGEGDDFFFIDGETEPSLRGTGTEDYFCDAWGFREQSGAYYGTPHWEGMEAGGRASAYRFHIADPVPFRKSLRVELEHKGSQGFPDGTGSGFIERDDLMASVAFWYQTEPHQPWPAIPGGPDRLATNEIPLVVGYKSVPTARHSGHRVEEQKLWEPVSDGKQFLFVSENPQGWVEIPFRTASEQTGELVARFVRCWDFGIYRVLLDGREVGVVDLYGAAHAVFPQALGKQTLPAGEHVLRFECRGKSEKSKGIFLGFDALVLRRPVYERPPGLDLRTIPKAQ